MSWTFSDPLKTLSDDKMNDAAKALWERETLGGLTEDNNRLPVPVVFLLILTILTAFSITFPLWGQRPTAAIYADQIKLMDSPEIKAIKDDKVAMQKITDMVEPTSKYSAMIVRHPASMDDLRILKPQIEALQAAGKDLEEYNVVGSVVAMANFEGNLKADGTKTRKQPWWDKGYTIDVFYVLAFCMAVMMVVKRLPPYTWQPVHSKH